MRPPSTQPPSPTADAIMNAVPAMALCLYGFLRPDVWGGVCFGAGLGITLFGISYMCVAQAVVVSWRALLRLSVWSSTPPSLHPTLTPTYPRSTPPSPHPTPPVPPRFVHDGLVHRRFPVGPIADLPAMKRIVVSRGVGGRWRHCACLHSGFREEGGRTRVPAMQRIVATPTLLSLWLTARRLGPAVGGPGMQACLQLADGQGCTQPCWAAPLRAQKASRPAPTQPNPTQPCRPRRWPTSCTTVRSTAACPLACSWDPR